MAFESITDRQISKLLSCPKLIRNPLSHKIIKDGHEQYNYKAIALDESKHEFMIYLRQNLREGMEDDFSCGMSWLAPNGETLSLIRYNGSSHNHKNHIENIKLGYFCHIHKATEKYIRANKKADGYAEITKRYKTMDGAFHCLVEDCNVSGISTNPESDQLNLFDP